MKINYDGTPIEEQVDEIVLYEDLSLFLEEGELKIDDLTVATNEKELDNLIEALLQAKKLGWLHETKVVVDNSEEDDYRGADAE